MKRTFTLLFTIIASLLVVSCQKELTLESDTPANPAPTTPGSSFSDIKGVYKFISLHATTANSTELTAGSQQIKTVALFDYVSENNAGTITIEDTKMTANNISYSINTISKTYTYENGTLSDSLSIPYQFDTPASSATSMYRRIGTDSLYFDQGAAFTGQASQNIVPSGAKIKVDQDKLYMTQSLNFKQTVNSGVPATATMQGTYVFTLQKQ